MGKKVIDVRFYELKQKEVINIKDGCRLGFVSDIRIDKEKGKVLELIIPGPGRIFGVFGREQEYRVEWVCVKQIGDDIILIDADPDKLLCDCEF